MLGSQLVGCIHKWTHTTQESGTGRGVHAAKYGYAKYEEEKIGNEAVSG